MLILWKLFGLLSFSFSFGSWFRREVEWERGLFTTKTWGGGT